MICLFLLCGAKGVKFYKNRPILAKKNQKMADFCGFAVLFFVKGRPFLHVSVVLLEFI